jgi:hypothetical protein
MDVRRLYKIAVVQCAFRYPFIHRVPTIETKETSSIYGAKILARRALGVACSTCMAALSPRRNGKSNLYLPLHSVEPA